MAHSIVNVVPDDASNIAPLNIDMEEIDSSSVTFTEVNSNLDRSTVSN